LNQTRKGGLSAARRGSGIIENDMPIRAADWTALRLKDRIRPGVRVLFVGINPGVRSALTGHHFAGYSNRFWKLLWDARLVPERITFEDDDRLPEFGFGMTNLVPRPSAGIDDLSPSEYIDGWKALDRKIRRYRPAVVALVGVTLYRAIVPLIAEADVNDTAARAGRRPPSGAAVARRKAGRLGPQPFGIHGARVFVLPNPSGRNANFSYAEMLRAFRSLGRYLRNS
jgi:double-stranded uracil-DNA glycosylase